MIILASASPRRAELLAQIGIEFEQRHADIDESLLPNEQARDYVNRLAIEKVEAVSKLSGTKTGLPVLGGRHLGCRGWRDSWQAK